MIYWKVLAAGAVAAVASGVVAYEWFKSEPEQAEPKTAEKAKTEPDPDPILESIREMKEELEQLRASTPKFDIEECSEGFKRRVENIKRARAARAV